MSLKSSITEYLKEKAIWVHKGELGRKAVLEWGFENENMGRRCRELENAGVIERELRKNPNTGVWEAWYRYLGASYNGNITPSKSDDRGSIPLAPANCCYWYTKYKEHSQDCKSLIKQTNKTLF